MCVFTDFRKVSIFSIFILCISDANATAISFSDSYVDFDSIQISGDVRVDEAGLLSEISYDDQNDSLFKSNTGGIELFSEAVGINGFAITDGVSATTNTTSEIADLASTSATSFLSALIPFTLNSNSQIGVSFDYGLFSSTDTDVIGEYALSSADIQFSLLDESENVLGDTFFDGTLFEGFDGSSNGNSVFDSFNQTYLGLSSGNYFLSFEVFTSAFTEANSPVSSVPSPGTMTLLLAGMCFLVRKKMSINPATKETRFTTAI